MDMSVLHKKVDIKITIAILSLEIFAALLSLVLIVYPNIHVKPVKASTSTGITIDYSTPVGTVSKNLFGESIEMEGGHLAKMVVDPYLSKSKNIGFTNVRMGGTSCETSYKWEDHTGATDTQNYVNWVKYSKLITGGTITGGGILTGGVVTGGVEPILCVNLTRSDYSDSATNWVKDMKDKGINVTYFEMGNEDIFQMNQTVCGTANPATCYAQRAQTACAAMKGINSNIKCGINLASSAYNDWWNRPVINGVANADFVIPHLYSPNAYFDTNYFYDVASKTFSGAPTTGNYAITVAARLRDQTNGNTAYNCQPKLKVQIGTQSQEFVPTIADWQTFTFDVSNPGTDQIILSNSGNLWN
ncbi:MAG: hypothetical protein NT094_02015, partial [Candidatus Staskawiczbacteria bacterium]|nr:hypothetical protein [Candidatus Staskawiczbacteria bacterium]